MWWIPSSLVNSLKIVEVNCLPRSEVRYIGEPNRDIHELMNAFATTAAVISSIGQTSTHRVYLSIMVKQYLKFLLRGNGPTKSMCMC